MNEITPIFPLQCDFCLEKHKGDIDAAIDDGWNFAVFQTITRGTIQMAGCPVHAQDVIKEMSDFVRV